MTKTKFKKGRRGIPLLKPAFQYAQTQDIRLISIITRKRLDWSQLKSLPDAPSVLVFLDSKITHTRSMKGLDTIDLELPDTVPQEWLELCLQKALKLGKVRRGQRVLCLFPLSSSSDPDCMGIIRLKERTEYVSLQQLHRLSETIPGEVLRASVDLAIELARDGREGKPVGSLFIIGDSQQVLAASRPMILNPFQGYSDAQRRITDPTLAETVKEIAQIDGAFVVRSDGVILCAGRYVDTPAKGIQLPKGLGARHVAAASISKTTAAIAITVSSSSRTVRVFRKGKIVMVSNPLRGLWV